MKKPFTILLVSALLILVLTSTVLATSDDLYDKIKSRLISIADQFINKESQLVEEGEIARQELLDNIDKIESEIENDMEKYEKEQVNNAKEALKDRVDEIMKQLENDKPAIEEEIKEKIKEKINTDLEKELQKIEEALDI